MSFTRIWLHCVWSTKNRESLISFKLRPLLLDHIRKYAESRMISIDYINAHINHIHLLINMQNDQKLSEIINKIKGESSFWVNKNMNLNSKFIWQDDYYAASISLSHIPRVRNYIKNQDEHHKHISWEFEINEFLKNPDKNNLTIQ